MAQVFTINETLLSAEEAMLSKHLRAAAEADEDTLEGDDAVYEVIDSVCRVLDGPPAFATSYASPTGVHSDIGDDITLIASLDPAAQIGVTVSVCEFRDKLGDDPTPREVCANVAAKLNASAEKVAELLAPPK